VWDEVWAIRGRADESAIGSIEYSTFTIHGSTIAKVNNRCKLPNDFAAVDDPENGKKKPALKSSARVFSE